MKVFVFPMLGLSKRFIDAGFVLPKYMLYVGSQSLFNLAVSSFQKYFLDSKFIFLTRTLYDTPFFVEQECKQLKVKNYFIKTFESSTKGQAETVYLGLNCSNLNLNDEIFIFNIDSFYTDFRIYENYKKCDGYLDVFEGDGEHWSFAELISDDSDIVKKTAEKRRISKFCSSGLYYFSNFELFNIAYEQTYINTIPNYNEQYIAPMYNHLIKNGYLICANKIQHRAIFFSGIPSEYFSLLNSKNYL